MAYLNSLKSFNPWFKQKLFPDFIFFLMVVALPSSFFALIPREVFYDLRLLYWMVGMLYGVFFFKYIKKINYLPGAKLLKILILFLLFNLCYSTFIHNIPIKEVLTIFRTNFFYPIAAFGFLLYVASMNNNRILRFLYFLVLATLLQGTLYLISNLLNINFFAVVSKEDFNSFQGETLLQNLSAIPSYKNTIFVFGLFLAVKFHKTKYHLIWLIPVALTIISIVRNQLLLYLVILGIFFYYGGKYVKGIKIGRLIKSMALLIFSLGVIGFTFSAHVGKLSQKFGFEEGKKIEVASHLEEGTYALRLRLIEEAFSRIEAQDNLWLGNGYIREGTKGEYDFVLGADTLIAPVLFTEGFLGLIFRISPFLFLLCFALKKIKQKGLLISSISLIILMLVIPSIPNIVQTKLFVRYTEIFFIIYVLLLYNYNNEKTKYHIYLNEVNNRDEV